MSISDCIDPETRDAEWRERDAFGNPLPTMGEVFGEKPERTDYDRGFTDGWNAAQAELEKRITTAERSRETALFMCERVNAHAKMIADMTQPGADLSRLERDMRPVTIRVGGDSTKLQAETMRADRAESDLVDERERRALAYRMYDKVTAENAELRAKLGRRKAGCGDSQWRPGSEQPERPEPGKRTRWLVCIEDTDVREGFFTSTGAWTNWAGGIMNVTAWRAMPEPPTVATPQTVPPKGENL